MSKLLLVEDDNNLREIYEARLQAEGYAIVTAKDGEEALAVAKTEKPDLIISDVMMPKISGFEMLDILKNTDGLKNVKVIMLTALGQSDDQQRANKLGADRYLVKSQVTLEDIVRVAHELLEDDEEAAVTDSVTAVPSETSAPSVTSSPPASAGIATPEPVAVPTPVPEVAKPSIAPAPSVPETTTSPVVSEPKEEVTAPPVATEPEPTPTASTPSDNAAVDEKLMNDAVSSLMNVSDPATAPVPSASPAPQTPADEPSASNTSAPVPTQENSVKLDVSQANEPTTASPTMSHGKVITPTADIATIDKKPDIQALYAAEQAKEAAVNQPNPAPVVVETQTAQPSTENRPVDPSSIAL